jgi:hypothetical protein
MPGRAEGQSWTVIKEFSEKGVSGLGFGCGSRCHSGDSQAAAPHLNDNPSGVYSFDRLGRRDDRNAFLWWIFVRNGIEVWSAVRTAAIDNLVDKLMNYIRTGRLRREPKISSVQRLAVAVRAGGRFRGGTVPYGYRLGKGRAALTRKNHEVNEILVDENVAAVVRTIFEKYVNEGLPQVCRGGLYDNGHLNRREQTSPMPLSSKCSKTSCTWASSAVVGHNLKSSRSCKSCQWIYFSERRS